MLHTVGVCRTLAVYSMNCVFFTVHCGVSFSVHFVDFSFSYTVHNNPDMSDILPHMRGQGVMDLEFEGDGKL